MYRGTTPTILITLPSDIDVSSIDVAYLSFEQYGAKVLEKALEDMTVITSSNSIGVALTQAETLAFKLATVGFQLRFGIGDEYYSTQIFTTSADRIIKDGEI